MSFCGLIGHFFLELNNMPLFGCTSIYLSTQAVEEYLSCFQVGALRNRAITDILMQAFERTWVFSSFGQMPESVIIGSYGKSTPSFINIRNCQTVYMVRMFNFVRNQQTCLLKWVCHFPSPPTVNESFCCCTSLTAFAVVCVLDFVHFNRYIVVSHCFYLQFSSDKWC